MMTEDYDNLDEDDIVIEGSDLHKVLIDMGHTDFECTPIIKSEFNDDLNENENLEDPSSTIKHSWLQNFIQSITNCWLHKPHVAYSHDVSQLEIILGLNPLLDDHSSMIQNMLEKKISLSKKRYTSFFSSQWPSLLVTNSILATGSVYYKSLRIPGFIAISSINVLVAYKTYNQLQSIKNIKKLISIQNNIYYLYKKILKILKNGYCLKLSKRQSQKQFSNLEIGRVKYLQPMCEQFIQSMEIITRTCYQISLLLMNYVNQKNSFTENLVTKLDDMTFVTDGEVTYEKLKQNYYVYILVQSEMMYIMAVLFENQSNDNSSHNSKLMRIINLLSQLFNEQKIKLNNIVELYKSSKAPKIHHELRNTVGTKLQDLYMHVDLLARKIQSAYNIVDSIIDDIDKCTNDDNMREIINSITEKINEAYKEIDIARNFAEFNTLLVGKFQYNQMLENSNQLNPLIINKVEKILPIVHDNDPQIIDEVFEEYIKDEYLKPLYEDGDIDTLERGKLDKLLAKNFMSELKEVLIDKYKTMSEREAKALVYYRKKIHNIDQDNFVNNDEEKVSVIPSPLPLPQLEIDESFSHTDHMKIRTPVPLPRSINVISNPNVRRRQKIDEESEPKILEANEKFLMNINMDIHKIKLPTFTTNEETFIGSGENSEEEIITDGE